MFAIIKTVILIKKHIIKNTLTLKKVLFIGLLSLIFNSNLHAQLAGPSSSWNTVIQSDVYGDAIYKSDAYKLDVFGNTTYPVLQSAFNGNNIYFMVLLNGSTGDFTGGKQKDFKFFIGIDADRDNDIDFFIYLERDKNKEDNDSSNKHYIGFWETDSGDQKKPKTTSWKSEDFIGSNDRYLSNSTINNDISGSGLNDHYYDFGFPLSELQDFISSDFPDFDKKTHNKEHSYPKKSTFYRATIPYF